MLFWNVGLLRWPSRVAVLGICLAALLLPVGCESAPAGVAEARSGSGGGLASSKLSRVPASALASNGLEEVHYDPPRDGQDGVHSVELLGNDLLIASISRGKAEGNLRAVNRADLITKWYCPITEPIQLAPTIYQYPQGSGNSINELFYSQLDTVYCLDLRVGEVLWRQKLDFPVSTRIAADEGFYFVGSDNGRAYGLRKNTKVDSWTYRTGDSVKTTPVVDVGNVLFASTDGSVYRLACRTGWVPGVSWKFKTGARILADMATHSRWVIAASSDYKVYCLELQNGDLNWSFQCEAPIEEAPVVYSHKPNQEYVFAIATARVGNQAKRTLFSIKLSSGEEVWRAKDVRKVVSLGKNHVYVLNDAVDASQRAIVALDILTGEEKFRFSISGFAFVPVNSADFRNPRERGRIYLVAEDGAIQLLGERL